MKFDNSPDKRSPGLRFKLAADTKTGEFSGHASTFNGAPDSYGDIIAPGAFSETLAAHKAAGSTVPMLWAHDQSKPIGRWLEMREDATGLFVRGKCNLDTIAGREAHAHIVAGDVSGLSIGFRLKEYSVDPDTGIWTLEAVELSEVSVVTIPANSNALITSKADLVDVLVKKAGLPRAAAAKVAAGGFSALSTKTEDADIEALVSVIKSSVSRLQKA